MDTALTKMTQNETTTGDASAYAATTLAAKKGMSRRRKTAILWGIVSSFLSVSGLIGYALFEQYNNMLSELRTDLKHFNQTSSEYVHKEQMQHFREKMHELYKTISNANATHTILEQELKASERLREDQSREIQRLRERVAYVEGLTGKKNEPGFDRMETDEVRKRAPNNR